MITSSQNTQIKHVIKLKEKSRERKKDGLFVVEGLKMFVEAKRDSLEAVYVTEAFFLEHQELIKGLETGYEVVDERVFRTMSDTVTPQGVLCLVKMPEYTIEDILSGYSAVSPAAKNPLVLFLEDIQDPGNLGTIMRTAEGAGVSGIVMSKDTVDIFNPKTIRSTMGSVYRVPFLYMEARDACAVFKERRLTSYAAHLEGRRFYDEEDYLGGTVFFIGNEGRGLSKETSDKADIRIKIPMCGQLESLNASIAASVLMYEANRQRRRQK